MSALLAFKLKTRVPDVHIAKMESGANVHLMTRHDIYQNLSFFTHHNGPTAARLFSGFCLLLFGSNSLQQSKRLANKIWPSKTFRAQSTEIAYSPSSGNLSPLIGIGGIQREEECKTTRLESCLLNLFCLDGSWKRRQRCGSRLTALQRLYVGETGTVW